MNYTVYKHISPSGKIYVGITKQKPEYRWNNGKNYRKDQILFHRAIQKYGWDNFTHIILYTGLNEKDAKNIEISLIKQYKALGISYNITDGGDGGRGLHSKRKPHTEEAKRKMSESRKGLLAGSKNPMYGRHETNPAYGKFGKEHPASKVVYQYDLLGNFIKKWDCISDAQRCLNIIVTHITACCNGRQKTAGGYIWKRQFDKKMELEWAKHKETQSKNSRDAELKQKQINKQKTTSTK